MSTQLQVDVLVLGGGPAGAIAARGLAQEGFATYLVEPRAATARRIGEVLPGSSAIILRDLGLWEGFLSQGHLASHAVRSQWGDTVPFERPLMFDAHGSGWHLDRARFDALLLGAAEQAGVCVLRNAAARSVQALPDGYAVAVSASGEARRSIQARFVVDATGRRAWFARRAGATWRRDDRLMAWATRYSVATCEAVNLIEAAENGWWYSAQLPQNELLVAYMSDADLAPRSGPQALAPLTRDRVAGASPRASASVWSACSGRLCRDDADRAPWLAAGDAAAAFDPLSGHGILFALRSGEQAARAAAAWLAGQRSAVAAYSAQVGDIYQAYWRERSWHYSREARFAEHPFWQRRASA